MNVVRLRWGISLAIVAIAAGAGFAFHAAADRASVLGEIEFSGGPGSAQPNLAVAGDGGVILTWQEPTSEGRHALRVAVRRDDRWSVPKTIRESGSFFVNWADFPSLIELPDGRWVVHWLEKVPGSVYAYHVNVAISRDGGAAWSEPIVPHRDRSPSEHGFVSMVPWPDGGVGLLWLDGREMKEAEGRVEGDMTLRFTTVRPDETLGAEAVLDERVCECCQTALARTRSGYLAAYRDRSPMEIRDIAVVRYADGKWTAPTYVAEDRWQYPGCPVNGPALSTVGDTVGIAWFTYGPGEPRVYAAFSYDGGARFGSPIRVDDGDPLGRVDIELLPDGSAAVVWLEVRRRKGEVRMRRVRPDGRSNRSSRVARVSNSRASGFPRLARVGDLLIFAWTETAEGGEGTAAGGVRVAVSAP